MGRNSQSNRPAPVADTPAAPPVQSTPVEAPATAEVLAATDTPDTGDTSDDTGSASAWPRRIKMAVGDGAVFEGKARNAGTDSIRVGVIYYASSGDNLAIPFTLYKRVKTGQKTGGVLSLSIPNGVELMGGLKRTDPEVAQWLESETLAWVAWFKAHGATVPAQARAAGSGWSGVSVDF